MGTEAVFVPLLGDSVFLQCLFMGSNLNIDRSISFRSVSVLVG